MSARRLAAPAAVAASALAFALYTRVEWRWFALGWIGFVPWLAALDRARSWRATLALALLMCVAFALAVFSWFATAIANYTGAPPLVGVLVLLAIAPVMQPQLITTALARCLVRRRGAGWWRAAVVGACIYVGTEWTGPKLFADTIGHGFQAAPLMRQAADVAGAPGLTFVLLIANACLLEAGRALLPMNVGGRSSATPLSNGARRRRAPPSNDVPRESVRADRDARRASGAVTHAFGPLAVVATLVITLLVYGAVRHRQLGANGGQPITVGMVQANLSHYNRLAAEMGTYDAARMILDAHFALSAEAMARAPLDLLLWPETVYPTTFGSPKSDAGAAFDRELGAFVQRSGVPLVFGSYDVDAGQELNAAVFLEPSADGRLTFATYRKAQLFPLTEQVPALLELAVVRRWLPWLGTWKPGRGPQVLPLMLPGGRTIRIAPLICYDAVYPALSLAAVRQGAEVIVTLSNDSWFATGEGPNLHLVVSVFRSLETRRPQLRVTNTGISAVILPTGELASTVGVHERAAVVGQVIPVREAWTLMLAWGDWFGPVALVVGIAVMLPRRERARKERR